MAKTNEFTIRMANAEDAEALHALIVELAIFERCGDAVDVSVAQLRRDGFSEPRRFDAFVAELEGAIVGMALYYPRYSTWKGMCLYLEDLIVRDTVRGLGIGKALLRAVVQAGVDQGAARVQWQVLDWNEDAIRFYKSLGAEIDGEWLDCKLHAPAMQELIKA
jgi:GNAT superfamily N-acetyltransferase